MVPRRIHNVRSIAKRSTHAIACPQRGSTAAPLLGARDGIVRNYELCKSPRANRTESRPVQVTGGRNRTENRPARRSQGKSLSECRPVQIAVPESVGISTCATHSVVQVAFSTGFFLPRPPRRPVRGAICRNIDLCKPFSCTSRFFDRIFPRDGADYDPFAAKAAHAYLTSNGDGNRRPTRGVGSRFQSGVDVLAVANGMHLRP